MNRMLRLKKNGAMDWQAVIKANGLFILLSVLLIAGIFAGVFSFKNGSAGFGQQIEALTTIYIEQGQSNTFLENMLRTIWSTLPYAAATLMLGVCVAGSPFILLIPFIKGLSFGTLAASLYAGMGFKGMAYAIIILMPVSFLSAAGVILMAKESLRFSLVLFRAFTKETADMRLQADIKLFLLRLLVFCVFFLLAALCDAVFQAAFAQFF